MLFLVMIGNDSVVSKVNMARKDDMLGKSGKSNTSSRATSRLRRTRPARAVAMLTF